MLVNGDAVCTPGEPWNAKFDRLATVEEAKESYKIWKNKLSHWSIVHFNGGVAKGPGYGTEIEDFGVENTQPDCEQYGHFLMCLPCARSGKLRTLRFH